MQNDKLNFVFLFYNKNFISNNKQNGNFRLAAFFVKCRDSLISFFNSNCGIQFCLATKQQKMQNFRLASFFCKTSDFKMISFCEIQFRLSTSIQSKFEQQKHFFFQDCTIFCKTSDLKMISFVDLNFVFDQQNKISCLCNNTPSN